MGILENGFKIQQGDFIIETFSTGKDLHIHYPHPFSEKIKKRRLLLEYSQKEVAKETGLSLKTIINIEKDCGKVGFDKVLKYLEFFQFELGEFIEENLNMGLTDDSLVLKQRIRNKK